MKINIHNSTYIFLLISFLSGYFEYMYLFLLTIFIHEAGHYIFGSLVNLRYPIIHIYPFGGITIFNEEINTSIFREFISLIGGIIFQVLFFFLIYKMYQLSLITSHVYIIIKKINFILISFNFMPILPLDGGRLLNLFLDIIFPYKISLKITIIISIIFSIIFLISNTSIFRIILFIFLIKCIVIEIINIDNKYNIFLFERYVHNYNFKRIKLVKSINSFKRDYYHIINNTLESVYLKKLFDKS